MRKSTEKLGEKIKNSNLYRSFCIVCKEPIRVCKEDINKDIYCQECDPDKHIGVGKPTYNDINYEGINSLEDDTDYISYNNYDSYMDIKEKF